MRIGLVVPHIFMQDSLLDKVIFSPADLALRLAEGLQAAGHEVFLYTPGAVTTSVHTVTGDMSGFDAELRLRGYGFIELLKKHPLTFATLARQVQADLIAKAYADANAGALDIVHMYANEEDIGLQFAQFCQQPVVLTHHDPFNLTVGYKQLFPRKKHLNYIAISESQKAAMPPDTNWLATIPHGMPKDMLAPGVGGDAYVAFIGRIIEAKGVHHAINAINLYNKTAARPLTLKIAGKYYQDGYFERMIQPHLNDKIEFIGFIKTAAEKQALLGGALATLVPSVFAEPFGMVVIESLACGTPVIGLRSGAIPEIIKDGVTGYTVPSTADEEVAGAMADALTSISDISRRRCREEFEARYTQERMVQDHIAAYKTALLNHATK